MRDLHAELRWLFLVCALATTLFVIYGSLVPFVLRPHSLAEALEMFSNIRYLQLGASSRADLLANAIIYIPVSMFWMAVVAPQGLFKYKRVHAIVAIAGLIALSVLVEFIQIYVAPRTVSKNDIISESVGIIGGALIWIRWGSWLSQGLQRFLLKGRISCDTLLLLSSLAVITYSLLPFDFFISMDEILYAIEHKGFPLLEMFTGSDSFQLSVHVFLVVILEFIITIILGFIAFRTQFAPRFSQRMLLFFAFCIFSLIEIIQFFEYSGSSSFTSTLSKTLGFYIGLRISTLLTHDYFINFVHSYKARFILLLPIYVLFIAFIKGWGLIPDFDLAKIVHVMSEVSFIPFYYHYFTTEMAALKSILLQLTIVTPLVFYWWSCDRTAIVAQQLITDHQLKPLQKRMWVTALLAFCLEIGGMLWANLRPDFSNILIIAFSIPLIYGVLGLLYRSVYEIESKAHPLTENIELQKRQLISDDEMVETKPSSNTSQSGLCVSFFSQTNILTISFALLMWALALRYWIDYPLSHSVLASVALIYLALLQRYPLTALIVIPAGIPVLDLYPISGRFFMTELDFMILITLGSQYLAGHTNFSVIRRQRLLWVMLIIITLVYLVSSMYAIWDRTLFDERTLTSFHSPMNVIRLSKAWIWFVLLLPILAFYFQHYSKCFLRFSQGILLGLLGLLGSVFIERYLFPGLFDFESGINRVRGSFVTMHTGGGHIDVFLVTVIPFLLYPFITTTRWWVKLTALIGLIFSLYAIFVTYSRGPYIIATLVPLVMLACFLLAGRQYRSTRWVSSLSILTIILTLSWASTPFIANSFLTQRLSILTQDKDIRVNQWERIANLVSGSSMTYLFGRGPGLMPRSIMLENLKTNQPSAIHELASDEGNKFLSLSSGTSLYTNQYIPIEQDKAYVYDFRYRSPRNDARLILHICEKWIDDSSRCQTSQLHLPASNDWTSVSRQILINAFPQVVDRQLAVDLRPKTLSISVGGHTRMALDDLNLVDMLGQPLIRNGGFSSGKDHWFITSDLHVDWHAMNLFINIYHDLGILGVMGFLILVAIAIWSLLKQLLSHNRIAIIMLGAFSGYLGIGTVVSNFEAPQLVFLFYLLVAVTLCLPLSRRLNENNR